MYLEWGREFTALLSGSIRVRVPGHSEGWMLPKGS